MWQSVGLVILGALVGFFGNMLVMAFTVNRKMDQILLRLPDHVTKIDMVAALKEERHAMREEVQLFGSSLEGDWHDKVETIAARVTLNETRIRLIELKLVRLTPPTKDETL